MSNWKSVCEHNFLCVPNSFFCQVATIYQACDKPDVKRALFSATLSNGIDDWAGIHLDNAVKVTVGIRYKLFRWAVI